VTGSEKHRNPRFLPYAFTEHGALMAANVLRSPRAVEMSVFVVRAFVHLRQLVATNAEVGARLGELERRVSGHDETIRSLVAAIRQLMGPPAPPPRKRIGFRVEEARPAYRRRGLGRAPSR
jgi:nucleoside-diphosphate-sugar epimerase